MAPQIRNHSTDKGTSVHSLALVFLILLTVIISFLTLRSYPFVHSDEAWLSGLSREMLSKRSLAVTESFFDLYPRTPHAFKSLFHLIQIVFLKIGGYNIFSFRLLSYLSGLFALFLMYISAVRILRQKNLALSVVLALALSSQFLYAAHFARQESLFLVLITAVLTLFFVPHKKYSPALSGVLLGLGFALHPNGFIIAFAFWLGALYLVHKGRLMLRDFFVFSAVQLACAVFLTACSLYLNPSFLTDYFAYGQTLGVTASLATKIKGFFLFYYKIYLRISGTYYLPEQRSELWAYLFVLITALFCYLRSLVLKKEDKKLGLLLVLVGGLNLGLCLLGRYNATSIVFNLPFLLLLTAHLINKIRHKYKYIIFIILLLLIAQNAFFNLYVEKQVPPAYEEYLAAVEKHVPPTARVLANLNLGYYFRADVLRDYRNLVHLREAGLSFSEYIAMNGIEYIIYPEEMDTVFSERPLWNALYGNPYYYYEEMQDFISKNCDPVGSFAAPGYAMRLVFYRDKKDWTITIYRVRGESITGNG